MLMHVFPSKYHATSQTRGGQLLVSKLFWWDLQCNDGCGTEHLTVHAACQGSFADLQAAGRAGKA